MIGIPVEQVRAGDVLELPRGATHVVVRVEGPFDDGTRVVIYAAWEEGVFENKARDHSGFNLRRRAVERSIVPLHAGELVAIVARGAHVALEEWRAEGR
jgi:hypothetical protein